LSRRSDGDEQEHKNSSKKSFGHDSTP
jgi:hypothetical protein